MTYAANVDDFHTSWEAVKAAAAAESKPIYLHFTTTWCGWCRRIEADTYTSELGSKALSAFVAASLDCTDTDSPAGRFNQQLLRKFGGTGFPFLAMVTADGMLLNTVSGYVPPAKFAAELGKAESLNRRWADFLAWTETADKTSYEYHQRAMDVYGKFGRIEEAATSARQLRKLDPEDKRGHAAAAALVLLREAKAQPESKTKPAKVKALADEIRRRDGDNAKGVLQHLLGMEAIEQLEKVAATKDVKARHRLLDEVAKRVAELQKISKLPDEVQLLWAYIGQFNSEAGRDGESRAALQKAYDAAPKSALAPQIKQLIDKHAGHGH